MEEQEATVPQQFVCSISVQDATAKSGDLTTPYHAIVELLTAPRHGVRIQLWNGNSCFSGEEFSRFNEDEWPETSAETFAALTNHRNNPHKITYHVIAQKILKSGKPVVKLSWEKKSATEKNEIIGSVVLKKTEYTFDLTVKALKTALTNSAQLSARRQELQDSLEQEKAILSSVREKAMDLGPAKQAEYTQIVSIASLLLATKQEYSRDSPTHD